MSEWHLQIAQNPGWHYDDQDVGDEDDAGCAIRVALAVNALPWLRFVPEPANWVALESANEECYYSEEAVYGESDP